MPGEPVQVPEESAAWPPASSAGATGTGRLSAGCSGLRAVQAYAAAAAFGSGPALCLTLGSEARGVPAAWGLRGLLLGAEARAHTGAAMSLGSHHQLQTWGDKMAAVSLAKPHTGPAARTTYNSHSALRRKWEGGERASDPRCGA